MKYVVFISNVIPDRDITLGNILELLQLVFYMSYFYGTIFSLLGGFMVPVSNFLMRRLTAGFSHSYSWMGHHLSHFKSWHFIYPECYLFWDVAVGQGIWKAGSSVMGYTGGLLLFLTTAVCLHSSWYVKLIQGPRNEWSWRMQLSILFWRNKKMSTELDIRSHIYNHLVTALVCSLWLSPSLCVTWRVQTYSSSVEGRGSKDLWKIPKALEETNLSVHHLSSFDVVAPPWSTFSVAAVRKHTQ